MYAYIKGTVEDIENDRIIIESNNIGYNVFVPASVMADIVSKGREIKLYTYLNVKEDAMNLFGFLSKEDLSLFKMLITVNGIGPKGAIGVLGVMNADDLRFAIISGDVKSITKAPGIGAKTAQKMILELKDKLSLSEVFEHKNMLDGSDKSNNANDTTGEAVMALTVLGYSQTEALKAIRMCEITKDSTVEDIIKEALKKLI